MGFVKRLVCGCDDKCKGHTMYSDETVLTIEHKIGNIIFETIPAAKVRTREIINRAIEESGVMTKMS